MNRLTILLAFFVATMPLMASCSSDEPSGGIKTLVAYFSATGNHSRNNLQMI